MPSADTIDTGSGPQDLATWASTSGGNLLVELSMVKFSDDTFWVAETINDQPQIRMISADGSTQTVLPLADKLSQVFPSLSGTGVLDLVLGTDGADIWCAFLGYDPQHFSDTACVDHPTPQDRVLGAYSLGVAVYAASAPSGSWANVGPAFYILGKDAAQTANAPVTVGSLPPVLPGGNTVISLQAGFTACASSTETGFFHAMWGELGYAGDFNPCDFADEIPSGKYNNRLSYTRWTASAIDTQVDLLSSTENYGTVQVDQGGAPLVADASAICNAVLKNDTGSAVAFICQLGSYTFLPVNTTGQLVPESIVRMWDMSSPSAGSPVEFQNSSGVAPVDLDQFLLSSTNSAFFAYLGPPDSMMLHCASAYTDPLVSQDVYLVSIGYISAAVVGQHRTFILRVPCDGSASFDFLDGSTAAGIGIGVNAGGGDFFSETRNVWWPSSAFAGTAHAKMMQYDRTCANAWLADSESPGEVGSFCPRGIDVTGDLISFVSFNNSTGMNHLTQQIILREVNDCGGGLNVWLHF